MDSFHPLLPVYIGQLPQNSLETHMFLASVAGKDVRATREIAGENMNSIHEIHVYYNNVHRVSHYIV